MTNEERTDLRKTTVGFVFQKYNLLPLLTAEDNIRICAIHCRPSYGVRPGISGGPQPAGDCRQDETQASCPLGRPAARVAIARGIVNSPAILLADEPTGNLDSENSASVLKLVKDLNHRLGQTILMITHDSDSASYADRVVRMRDGCIV